MKKLFIFLLPCALGTCYLHAQNVFPVTGRVGIYTIAPATSLQVLGGARIGTLGNYTNIDSATGNLSFAGTSNYLVANNQFAFRAATAPNLGLYFNQTNVRIEFRNSSGTSVFNVGVGPTANNVGIGTTAPAAKLDVTGGDALINGVTIGRGTGAINSNTAMGNGALKVNTSGSFNSAFGFSSLTTNKEGSANTAMGSGSLNFNTNGNSNVAMGRDALFYNTSGYFNTAFGDSALRTNNNGNNNTGLGYNANVSFANLKNATAIGSNALVAQDNSVVIGSIGGVNGAIDTIKVGIGTTMPLSRLDVRGTTRTTNFQMTNGAANGFVLKSDAAGNASWANITEVDPRIGSITANKIPKWDGTKLVDGSITDDGTNILIKGGLSSSGDALINNIKLGKGSQTDNMFLGTYAFDANTYGYSNTAVGNYSLQYNDSGFHNTALGNLSLQNNKKGWSNTAIGFQALLGNTSGTANTAEGEASLYSNTEGSRNTAIGFYSMHTVSIVNNSTALGSYTNIYGSNSVAIGYQAFAGSSNQVSIGNESITSIGGFANWTNISDGRIKRNIKENVPGLAFINKLNPVTYNLNLDAAEKIAQRPELKDKDGKVINSITKQDLESRKTKEQIVYTGFVAQDVEKAAKSIGYDFSGVDAAKNSKDLYGLRYAEFVVPLVKAVQELSKVNDEKDAKIENLQKQLNDLKTIVLTMQQCSPCPGTAAATTQEHSTIITDGALLEQNIPNPFTNSTVINYTLPQKYTAAQMVITDKNGKVLKEVTISGSGKGMLTVDASTLSNGAYQYSLWIGNKVVATKQMILAK